MKVYIAVLLVLAATAALAQENAGVEEVVTSLIGQTATATAAEGSGSTETKFRGEHKFEGVDTLKCETCKYMMQHVLNKNLQFNKICEALRDEETRSAANSKTSKSTNKQPLSSVCSTFVSQNGEKLKNALTPAAVCGRMGLCAPAKAEGDASETSTTTATTATATTEASKESEGEGEGDATTLLARGL